jgi:signal transduction histidine kinase
MTASTSGLRHAGSIAGSAPAGVAAKRRLGWVIEIADDGVGGADAARGSGLSGRADRVAALDGNLRVSSKPGAGTVITAELPCAS